ncbi:hypothetical protein A3H80_03930 [Candidatus Roizmanbacteria bacterium RIFCSPLOWO2_02_FULL_37_19]|uniref:histidine kinase n=1 Tax=Candidatus Roizmanbacteria bacterium RIFCSPHIGHO2_02_FULL_37_24 TaxID=1802037 RepID=A0A1F7GX13_9BACT|nr:MAG: hypothetical protein A3C24_03920 [Candidatus Roizmanbacteria bacterium RIFCSPHIGHO2_02_FULL_37_24]OGK32327.1 MAG: hypothetical protein A3E10_04160 [Candidatus Roizmanbacteria bacterium RIFCSPHIGHO2_12_FULL_37_23]OGK54845.1 MAG: hypothetical protein A3H80_03930 [Candidatus Roizmanbacteria bacterium RIFCSPLOWO2_02_FULL_37_19]OGK60611.1 MAG: hypothetical protein A3G65_03350 [Candidatus Roizmanbacteria bacterium RIFCSPLOWO2_12_FULL_37_7b]
MEGFFSSISFVLILCVILTDLVIAIFVYKNNPHSSTNKLFTLLSLVIPLWLSFNYLSVQPTYLSTSLFWIRLSFLFAMPLSLLFFLLAHTLPSDKILLGEKTMIAIVGATSAVMAIVASPLTISGIEIVNNTPQPVTGLGMVPFSILSTLYSAFAIFVLLKKLRRSSGTEREQIRWIISGIFIMLSLIIGTILVPLLLFKTNVFVSFLPLYTAIFIVMTAYAIIKHKFLDIRALVTRSVAYTILIVIIGFFYAGSIIVIGQYVFGFHQPRSSIVIMTIFAFVIAYFYQPLLREIEKVTDRFFYKNRYDSNVLLAKLSRVMASTLELDELVNLILRVMISEIKIPHGSLLLMKSSHVFWSRSMSHRDEIAVEFNHKDITFLINHVINKSGEGILLYEEILHERIKQIMRSNNISVVFPLVVNKNPIGVMLFPSKSSGDIYSIDDIHLFKILAPEIAVAVKNSLQYDEIKRFSIKLEQRIKEATKNLQDANRKLQELDQMKDDFVSVASHELRTPMTAIKSYLWMALEGKGGALKDKQRYYLDRAYNSTDRLIKLVNDMLNISRIESGRITVEMKKVDLAKLVQEVIDEVKPRAEELGISIRITRRSNKMPNQGSSDLIGVRHDRLKDNIMFSVLADPDKIKEVLFNLIGNSLKFTERDGEIRIDFAKEKDKIITNVKDTGKGIDAKDIPTLFTKFGMVEGSYATNKKASGTGLGLYISKSIIELHNGSINVHSDGIGKGALFTFSLPMYAKSLEKKLTKKFKNKREEGKDIIHSGI